MAAMSRPAPTFTPKQGQYLAFIHLYTRLHRRPPAETDMQEYFRVSPRRFIRWCWRSNGKASSADNREPPAASNCSLIRSSCQSYFDPPSKSSKSL
jgi:hypothetical protein